MKKTHYNCIKIIELIERATEEIHNIKKWISVHGHDWPQLVDESTKKIEIKLKAVVRLEERYHKQLKQLK